MYFFLFLFCFVFLFWLFFSFLLSFSSFSFFPSRFPPFKRTSNSRSFPSFYRKTSYPYSLGIPPPSSSGLRKKLSYLAARSQFSWHFCDFNTLALSELPPMLNDFENRPFPSSKNSTFKTRPSTKPFL